MEQGNFMAAAEFVIKIFSDEKLRLKLSAEARKSIQPILDYDFAAAWKNIFADLENNSPLPLHSENTEKLQNFLLAELKNANLQIGFLNQKLMSQN